MKRTTQTILIALTLFGLGFLTTSVALAADKAPTIVKRDQLPANLKGGKQPKNSDGIPGCTTGRAKVELSTLGDWAATHPKHDCSTASTVYVCRAGKNISVRCE